MTIQQDILASTRQQDRERVARQWTHTFLHNNDAATNMARLLVSCIGRGDFQVKDYSTKALQAPFDAFSISDYLSHGSRISVDASHLNEKNYEEFLSYFPAAGEAQVFSRSATHDISRVNGTIKEGKGILLGLAGQLHPVIKTPRDFGVNIAMGGEGQINFERKKIRANGYSGHFYFHRNDSEKLFLLGLEQTAPAASLLELFMSHPADAEDVQQHGDQYGQGHSLVGASDTFTAAGSLYFSDPVIQVNSLLEDNCFPPEKYGAMQLTLTNDNWPKIKIFLTELQQSNEARLFEELMQPPSSATSAPREYDSFIAIDFARYLKHFVNGFLNSAQKDAVKPHQIKLLAIIKNIQAGQALNNYDLNETINTMMTLELPVAYKNALQNIGTLFQKQFDKAPVFQLSCRQILLEKRYEELEEKQADFLQKAEWVREYFNGPFVEKDDEINDFLKQLAEQVFAVRTVNHEPNNDLFSSWIVVSVINEETVGKLQACLEKAYSMLDNIPKLYSSATLQKERAEWQNERNVLQDNAQTFSDKIKELEVQQMGNEDASKLQDAKIKELQEQLLRNEEALKNQAVNIAKLEQARLLSFKRSKEIASFVVHVEKMSEKLSDLSGEAQKEGKELVAALDMAIIIYLTTPEISLETFKETCTKELNKSRVNLYQRSSLFRQLVQEALAAVVLLGVGYAGVMAYKYFCEEKPRWTLFCYSAPEAAAEDMKKELGLVAPVA